jgi:hypothetical protein
MESDPFRRALARLDAAIARAETAVSALAPAQPKTDDRFVALEARHARLRAGATDALARLDRLIDAHPPEGEP